MHRKGDSTGASPERRPARRQSRRPVGRASQLSDLETLSVACSPRAVRDAHTESPLAVEGSRPRALCFYLLHPGWASSTGGGRRAGVETRRGLRKAWGESPSWGRERSRAIPPPLPQLCAGSTTRGVCLTWPRPLRYAGAKEGGRKRGAVRTRLPSGSGSLARLDEPSPADALTGTRGETCAQRAPRSFAAGSPARGGAGRPAPPAAPSAARPRPYLPRACSPAPASASAAHGSGLAGSWGSRSVSGAPAPR